MERGQKFVDDWRETFFWYPDAEQGDPVSPRAELTRLDPSQYREVVYDWRLSDVMVWMEESRVRDAFEDIS